jgi:hypothetical protein
MLGDAMGILFAFRFACALSAFENVSMVTHSTSRPRACYSCNDLVVPPLIALLIHEKLFIPRVRAGIQRPRVFRFYSLRQFEIALFCKNQNRLKM